MVLHAGELHPTQRVGVGNGVAAHVDRDLRRAGLHCARRIVEPGRTAAEHRHPLAAQRREIDGIGSVVPSGARQGGDHVGDVALSAAIEVEREDDAAGGGGGAVRKPQGERAAGALWLGDAHHPRPVPHLDAGGIAEPGEVIVPFQARHQVDALPSVGAVAGLVPAPDVQGRAVQLDAAHVLGAAQRVHARVVGPAPDGARLGGVEDEDAADAGAPKGECAAQARLPATDDGDGQVRAAGPVLRQAPPRLRVGGFEVLADPSCELIQRRQPFRGNRGRGRLIGVRCGGGRIAGDGHRGNHVGISILRRRGSCDTRSRTRHTRVSKPRSRGSWMHLPQATAVVR